MYVGAGMISMGDYYCPIRRKFLLDRRAAVQWNANVAIPVSAWLCPSTAEELFPPFSIAGLNRLPKVVTRRTSTRRVCRGAPVTGACVGLSRALV